MHNTMPHQHHRLIWFFNLCMRWNLEIHISSFIFGEIKIIIIIILYAIITLSHSHTKQTAKWLWVSAMEKSELMPSQLIATITHITYVRFFGCFCFVDVAEWEGCFCFVPWTLCVLFHDDQLWSAFFINNCFSTWCTHNINQCDFLELQVWRKTCTILFIFN